MVLNPESSATLDGERLISPGQLPRVRQVRRLISFCLCVSSYSVFRSRGLGGELERGEAAGFFPACHRAWQKIKPRKHLSSPDSQGRCSAGPVGSAQVGEPGEKGLCTEQAT